MTVSLLIPEVGLQERLLKEAEVCFMLAFYRGKRWLKADILNPFTDEEALDSADSIITECAALG